MWVHIKLILSNFTKNKETQLGLLGNFEPFFFIQLGNLLHKVGSPGFDMYRQTSNISRNLLGNKIVDHSDVVGVSPVSAAPTTSSFSTLASMDWAKTTARLDEKHLIFVIWSILYWRFDSKLYSVSDLQLLFHYCPLEMP